MHNEEVIRKLVNLFQYKRNQLLKGKLLSSAIPNTKVQVQTDIGIKTALNLNITNATDECLVTKDIDSNELVVFSLPRSNNTRTINIVNRVSKVKNDKEKIYRVKVLFYKFENNVYNYYIGGDRKVPIKIYSTNNLPTKAHLANTGKTIRNWAASFQFDNRIEVVNSTGTYTWNYHSYTQDVQTIGMGWWKGEIRGNNAYTVESSCTQDGVNPPYVLCQVVSSETCSYIVTKNLDAPGSITVSGGGGSYSEAVMDDFNQNQVVTSLIDQTQNESATNLGYLFDKQEMQEEGLFTSDYDLFFIKPCQQDSNNHVVSSVEDTVTVFVHKDITKNSYSLLFSDMSEINFVNPTGEISNQTIDTTPFIAGQLSYLLRQKTVSGSTTYVNGNITNSALTSEDKLVFGTKQNNTWNEVSINYIESYSSLVADYGATLKGDKYYLASLSTQDPLTSGFFGQNLWAEKTIAEYQSLNIYDNPTLGGKPKEVPVWVAQINESGVTVLSDIYEKVYPIPSGSTVVAASYY